MSLTPFVVLEVALDGAGTGTVVRLGPEDQHHLRRVLRLPDGAAVVVTDGAGRHAEAALVPAGVELATAPVATPAPTPRLTVVQGLPKGRKLDDVVRQVTELGADRIVPVAAARSVVRLSPDRAAKATERWRAVARAAAEQARRPWRCRVDAPHHLADLPALLPDATLVVAHPGGHPLPEAVPPGPDHLAVLVGPEGGWSDDEVADLRAAGAVLAALGPTVLRTEHAAPTAVAVLAALHGRWA